MGFDGLAFYYLVLKTLCIFKSCLVFPPGQSIRTPLITYATQVLFFTFADGQGTSYCWPIYKKRRIANTALVSTFACNLTFPDWRWQPISVPHGSQDNWLNWMVNNLKRKLYKITNDKHTSQLKHLN